MADEDSSFDPSCYSTLRLFKHITMKGIQLASLCGCGIILPILAIRGYRIGKRLDFKLANKALSYTTATGTAFACVVGIGRYMTIDKEGLEDRVYRLHFNETQNRCDRLSLIFGLLGAASSAILLNPAPLTLFGGFSSGVAFGTMAHIATSPKKLK